DQYLGGVGALPVDASNPDQIVTVVAGSNTLPVQVDGGRTVSGTITAPETVDLEGLTVQLYRGTFADGEYQGGYVYLGTTTPSVAGTYELAGLTSGEYFTVGVSGPGVMEQVYDGVADVS